MSLSRSPHVISREDLAREFGLEELRVGRHTLRNYPKHGEPIGSLWVRYFWILEVKPSFDPHSILCAVEAQGEEFEKQQTPGWLKAAYATSANTAVISLREDAVSTILKDFDLLSSDRGLCLDGIGYQLTIATTNLEGTLNFSNPRLQKLVKLEAAALSVAQQIASESKNRQLIQSLKVWQRYASHG